MSQELHYLTQLCRAYLENAPVTLSQETDYALLYAAARNHNISPTVFCVINTSTNKAVVPAEVFRQFENDFFSALMRYERQGRVMEEVREALTAAGIRHVFFKGAQLRAYYPVPEARVMGDIDLLIDEAQRDSAKAALLAGGFTLVHDNGPVYDYKKDNVKIEVHTKIISGKVGNADAERGFADAMEHAVFDGCTGVLEENYHFAYLIAHTAHHFWFYGAGMKLVLDLAVMQRQFTIDTDRVLSLLDSIGLAQFARVLLSVCAKWFGTGECYTDDTEKTERFLLSHGAFGKSNRNNAAVVQRKEMERASHTSAAKTRLRLLFPRYEQLKYIPYIRFIEGRPYLTPLAWVYRIIYNLRYRRDFVKSATAGIGRDETNSDAAQELAYFKEIGLL